MGVERPIPGYIYQEATDLLKRAKGFSKEAKIGVDEATFAPKPEYPNLPIAILLATDIHYGSLKTNYDLLDKHLQAVEDTPNMYMVSNGDEVDNFSAIMFPSGMTENPLPPQLQSMALLDKLKTLGEKGKIGAVSFGNHNDFMEGSGYTWLETFGKDINAPVFTSGGFLHVLHGEEHYGLAMTHTYWGRSKLNPTNANKRFMDFEYPQADVAFLGHTHQSEALHFEKGGKDRIAVIGGTYKTDNDDYARKRGIGGRAGSPGNLLFLYPDSHRMAVIKDFDTGHQALLSMIFREETQTTGIPPQGEIFKRP